MNKTTVLAALILALILAATCPVWAADPVTVSHPASVTVGQYINFTVSDPSPSSPGINFGTWKGTLPWQGEEYQSSAGGSVRLTVAKETNIACSVQMWGTDFTDVNNSSHSFGINQVKWETSDISTTDNRMAGLAAPVTIAESTPGTVFDTPLFYYIQVPGGTMSGDYKSSFYYRATAKP